MNQLMSFDEFNEHDLAVIQQQIMAKQNEFLKQRVEQLENQNQKIITEFEIMKIDQKKNLEVAVNSLRVKEGRFEFINAGDFGRYFSVSIGAVFVGRLFRIVGLAQPNKGSTIPYRKHIPKYAKTNAASNYTSVSWHYVNCLKFIDEWLQENGYYEEFYSIQSEKEMEKFINQLHEIKIGA